MLDPFVVLVEDEPQTRRFLRATLIGQGYRLFEAGTGADGLVEMGSSQPVVVIIDLGLPDIEGLEVIRRMREWSDAPIIVLSARGQERDKVAALDAGADDYVGKPFSAGELLARIRVALRHTARASHETDDATFKVGDLQVDLMRRRVALGTVEVRLTPIEYKLLTTLVRHAGKVVTHQQLLRDVWGPTHTDQAHYVRVYMAHLRHKLEGDPARPRRCTADGRTRSRPRRGLHRRPSHREDRYLHPQRRPSPDYRRQHRAQRQPLHQPAFRSLRRSRCSGSTPDPWSFPSVAAPT